MRRVPRTRMHRHAGTLWYTPRPSPQRFIYFAIVMGNNQLLINYASELPDVLTGFIYEGGLRGGSKSPVASVLCPCCNLA